MRLVETASERGTVCLVVAEKVEGTGSAKTDDRGQSVGIIDWGFAAEHAPATFRGCPYGRIRRYASGHWDIDVRGVPESNGCLKSHNAGRFLRLYSNEELSRFEYELYGDVVLLVSADDFAVLEPLLFPASLSSTERLCMVVRVAGTVATSYNSR